jgi:hypothetical protein
MLLQQILEYQDTRRPSLVGMNSDQKLTLSPVS